MDIYNGVISVLSFFAYTSNFTWCDVCTRKGVKQVPAEVHCTKCEKSLCMKHEEFHDEVNPDHNKISTAEYKSRDKKDEVKTCTKHKDQPLILGCKLCLRILCLRCIPELDKCTNGEAHELIPLDELSATLRDKVLTGKLSDLEEKLEQLFNSTSKGVSEYDNETQAMIKLLRDTRDSQLEELKKKYQKVEDDFTRKRAEVRVKLTDFMEDEVGVKWSGVKVQRLKMEAKLRHSNDVDIVSGYEQITAKLKQLTDEALPMLDVESVVTLSKRAESRELEIELVSDIDLTIDLDKGLTTSPLPKSLSLLKTVDNLNSSPSGVCHYKGNTYVGLVNCVVRIDCQFNVQKPFITCTGWAESISVYEDRIYIMTRGNPHVIEVYDLTGQLLTQWNHSDYGCGNSMNTLTIISDQVVIADRTNKRLTVYSLTGQTLRHIPCTLLTNSYDTMCAADDVSVIISAVDAQVSRVNINTGKVMWTTKGLNKPGGVSCYKNKYVFVAHHSRNIIIVLDIITGRTLLEVKDDALGGSTTYGLCVTSDLLIVPKCGPNRVLFYKWRK